MSEEQAYWVRCLQCGARNSLPLERLGAKPRCGRCRQDLFKPESPLMKSGAILVTCSVCQGRNRVDLKQIHRPARCGRCRERLAFDLKTPAQPLAVGDHNFTYQVLWRPQPALVEFFSPNCGPCRTLAPLITRICRDYEGRLLVATCNVEVNQYVPSLYAVGATPTMVLIVQGAEVSRLNGLQSSSQLRQWLRPHCW